jgi:hypothetical protein
LLNYGFAGQLKDKIRPLSLIKKHRLIKYTNPPHNELKQTGRVQAWALRCYPKLGCKALDDGALYEVLPNDWQTGKDTFHAVSTPKQRVACGKILLDF